MTVPPLIASYYTLAGIRPLDGAYVPSPYDLRDRIAAAAAAGYKGIGVDVLDLQASVERHGHAGIKAMLVDHGLDYFEIEGMGDWYATGPARAASDAAKRDVFLAGERIGLSQVKLTGNVFGRSYPVDVMRREFAAFCDDAAKAGFPVTLEMVCISDIADLKTALAVIGDTAAGNGGLLADIWHFMRGNVPLAELAALPQGVLKWVELDDGAATPAGSIISEQLDDRRLPGEGAFDIAGFLAATRTAGYAGPAGIEILSQELRDLPLAEAARRSFDHASRQFVG